MITTAADGGDNSRLFLQFASLIAGGGVIQLLIAILRRRSELREIDVRSDSVALNMADQLAVRLAAEAERQAARGLAMETRIDELRGLLDQTSEQLTVCKLTNQELTREVAGLRLDLQASLMQFVALQTRNAVEEPAVPPLPVLRDLLGPPPHTADGAPP